MHQMRALESLILVSGLLALSIAGILGHSGSKELLNEKKGYLSDRIFTKFQNLKNYITIPIPTKLEGPNPILYKPYLNFKPKKNTQLPPLVSGQGQVQGSFPFPAAPSAKSEIISLKKSKIASLHQWKDEKKQKINELKEVVLRGPTTTPKPEISPEEQIQAAKELALLKHYHMHGVIDSYRPKPGGGPFSAGWSRPKPVKSKSKKVKNKKKKLKKKKKKASEKGWTAPPTGWDVKLSTPATKLGSSPNVHAPAAARPKPKRKPPKKKKIKPKNKGWSNDDASRYLPKVQHVYPAPLHRPMVPLINPVVGLNSPIIPTTEPAITNGYHISLPDKKYFNYKIQSRNPSPVQDSPHLIHQRPNSKKLIIKRILEVEPEDDSYEARREAFSFTDSSEPTEDTESGFQLDSTLGRTTIWDEVIGSHAIPPVMLEPGHELYFHQMPRIYEDYSASSIY